MKKGFTVVEFLVALSIVITLCLLLLPGISVARYNAQKQHQIEESSANSHGVFCCLKSFVTYRHEDWSSRLKVSLKSVDSPRAYVFICKTDEAFAQFEDNKYYEVGWIDVDGIRYVVNVEEVTHLDAERN
jgi:hypothetical protein